MFLGVFAIGISRLRDGEHLGNSLICMPQLIGHKINRLLNQSVNAMSVCPYSQDLKF